MSIKKFIKRQFQIRNFHLKHDMISDFYLSCFQKSQSIVPLLVIRVAIFVGCLSILLASMVLTANFMPFRFWPIYMTHWGLVINTIAAGLALLVSAKSSLEPRIDTSRGLPWYVQAYWAMFNLATPIALFISVFYWILLTGIEQDFAINLTLDIFIHAVNSILMFVLLISSRHPVLFLHFYIPIGFSIVYLIFSFIYYVSNGTDAFGNHTIYPMLDWEKPGETVGMVLASAIGIIVLHGVVVALAAGRDVLNRRFKKRTMEYDVDEV